MRLRTIVAFATIIMAIIIVLQYVKIEPNALDKLLDVYKEAAEKDVKETKIAIKSEDYENGNDSLYAMYRAAIAISISYSKDRAIEKVVNAALIKNDFKLAIAAAKESENSYTKSNLLEKIAKQSLNTEKSIGYSIVAAELIPNNYTKNQVLQDIVGYYEKDFYGDSGNKIESKKLAPLEIYKEIFTFADSSAHMSMSKDEAKLFADRWIKNRTYIEFQNFKTVFTFADSSAHMAMNVHAAHKFTLKWLDNYTMEEFKIFEEAFSFADSSAEMNMSTKDAEKFAFQKVAEHRESEKAVNKKIQPTANNGG